MKKRYVLAGWNGATRSDARRAYRQHWAKRPFAVFPWRGGMLACNLGYLITLRWAR